MWVEFVVGPDFGVALDGDVRVKVAAVAEGDVVLDDAEGADFYIFTDFGLGGNDGGGVDHRGRMSWRRGRVKGNVLDGLATDNLVRINCVLRADQPKI